MLRPAGDRAAQPPARLSDGLRPGDRTGRLRLNTAEIYADPELLVALRTGTFDDFGTVAEPVE